MRLNKGQIESEPRYDIAMLYLDRDVRLAPNVAPACLPQPEYLNLPPGALGTVVGWVQDINCYHKHFKAQDCNIEYISDNITEVDASNRSWNFQIQVYKT